MSETENVGSLENIMLIIKKKDIQCNIRCNYFKGIFSRYYLLKPYKTSDYYLHLKNFKQSAHEWKQKPKQLIARQGELG